MLLSGHSWAPCRVPRRPSPWTPRTGAPAASCMDLANFPTVAMVRLNRSSSARGAAHGRLSAHVKLPTASPTCAAGERPPRMECAALGRVLEACTQGGRGATSGAVAVEMGSYDLKSVGQQRVHGGLPPLPMQRQVGARIHLE